ncbi:MAG: hypothetical protein GY772_17620 [bacterium]|nr:hypothetical protein [bacterium]
MAGQSWTEQEVVSNRIPGAEVDLEGGRPVGLVEVARTAVPLVAPGDQEARVDRVAQGRHLVVVAEARVDLVAQGGRLVEAVVREAEDLRVDRRMALREVARVTQEGPVDRQVGRWPRAMDREGRMTQCMI